jgi:hypothetical protein
MKPPIHSFDDDRSQPDDRISAHFMNIYSKDDERSTGQNLKQGCQNYQMNIYSKDNDRGNLKCRERI